MRVKELLKQLEGRDPDMEVLFILDANYEKLKLTIPPKFQFIVDGVERISVFIPENCVTKIIRSEKSLKTPTFFEKILKKIGL